MNEIFSQEFINFKEEILISRIKYLEMVYSAAEALSALRKDSHFSSNYHCRKPEQYEINWITFFSYISLFIVCF